MDDLFNRYPVNHAFQIVAYRTVDEYHWDKNHLFTGESHNFWEFICVLEGEAESVRGNQVFHLRPGNFLADPPMVFHSSRSLASACHVLNFSCEISGNIPANLIKGIFYLSPTEIDELTGIFHRILSFATECGDPDIGSEASHAMESFLLRLARQHTPHHRLSNSHNSILYKKIVEDMEETLYENISIQQIAVRNGVSTTTIKDLFRSFAGIGPKRYYANMRGIEALRLLDEGLEIEQITEIMNYSSTSYFPNTFKKQFGLPPGQFRKNRLKQDN